MQHRTQSDLAEAPVSTSGRAFNTPTGYLLGWGTTVGNGVEGWSPGALFIDTNAAQGSQVYVNTGTKTSATFAEIADAGVAGGFTMAEAANIVLGTTTGTKVGTATSQKLGFYNKDPVVQPTALTAVDATAIDSTYGSVEEAVLNNVRTRLGEVETKLKALGLLA